MTTETQQDSSLLHLNRSDGMPGEWLVRTAEGVVNVDAVSGATSSTKDSAVPAVTDSAPSKGVKFDGGKSPVVQGCLHYFPRALCAVADISAYGAKKYKVPFSDKNWMKLEDAKNRYDDADGRHLLAEGIDGLYDPESGMLHAAHHAWDANARLELMLAAGVPLRKP